MSADDVRLAASPDAGRTYTRDRTPDAPGIPVEHGFGDGGMPAGRVEVELLTSVALR